MKEGRKPQYPKKSPDDELQKRTIWCGVYYLNNIVEGSPPESQAWYIGEVHHSGWEPSHYIMLVKHVPLSPIIVKHSVMENTPPYLFLLLTLISD